MRINMISNTNTRGEHRSTLKSNPKDSQDTLYMSELRKVCTEGTILDNMNKIMKLVEDNKKIRSRR